MFMDLYGWNYSGRKISPEFHKIVLVMDDFFNDPYKVGNKTWPALQRDLGNILHVQPGQIRTIKVLMEELGILKCGSLNKQDVPLPENIYTNDGQVVMKVLRSQAILSQNLTEQNIKDIISRGKVRLKERPYTATVLR